jgi:chromosome segregation ATPase
MQLVNRVNQITDKVTSLLKRNQQKDEVIEKLTGEREVLRQTINSYEMHIQEMKEEITVLRAANLLRNNKDGNKEVKLQINHLIKEIDKCIALVSK